LVIGQKAKGGVHPGQVTRPSQDSTGLLNAKCPKMSR